VVAFRLRAGGDELGLFDLPWSDPLEAWPEESCVRVPVGIHRHVVRFLQADGTTLALKELPQRLAEREYRMLERLREERLPGVTLVGIATDRSTAAGRPLEAVLVTRHLPYSLPFRYLFSESRHSELRDSVVDALAVLLVRLHMAGFFWGDCSLGNSLFRRDAGALRAYVVDTETAEWHERLSEGQRLGDLEIATENIFGGLLDIEAEGLLGDHVDPAAVALRPAERYRALWAELNDFAEVSGPRLGWIQSRLARLNDLGFDTEEYELHAGDGTARFRPTVVEEGHHKRTLARLTGIEAHENQARRLLSALRGYGAWLSEKEGVIVPEAVVAYRWLNERWQPVLDALPPDVRDRLEPAEIFHEILRHNWRMNDDAGRDVPLTEAARDYGETVLSRHRDERTVLPVADS